MTETDVTYILALLHEEFPHYTVVSVMYSSNHSVYITLLDNMTLFYLQFRISTHKAKTGFYSNKTFYYEKDSSLDFLFANIAVYLKEGPWAKFTYEDYFVLSLIKDGKYNCSKFFVDNLYGIFTNNAQGLLIYQELSWHKNNKTVNIVSEAIEAVFRKLFATGVISYWVKNKKQVKDEQAFPIYISEAGFKLMEVFHEFYAQRYKNMQRQIRWDRLHSLTMADMGIN